LLPGCLHVAVPGDLDPEVVADRCWLLGATAIGESAGGLEVGFGTEAEAVEAAAALGSWRPDLAVRVLDAGPALDAALAAWRPFARPVRVGRLRVRPAWLVDPPVGEGIEVVVDPTRAFGYDHPSTLACLEAVDRWVGPGTSVLDVGCGSGVLAVAAAALGAAPVVAVDTDPVAVAATRAAAGANGVEVEVSGRAVGEVAGAFDLVLANIGAAALRALAPDLAARVAPGGRLVLAGILDAQAAAVGDAYVAAGLHPVATARRRGWASPVFIGKSTTRRR
jgi:ribosomal protein L11 methyltransferase